MFSPNEEKILKILGRKKMTITAITKKFYGENHPVDANNNIAGTLRRIRKKCTYDFKCTFNLSGEGRGRGGRTVWKTTKFRL